MTQEPSSLSDMEEYTDDECIISHAVAEVEWPGIVKKHGHERRRAAKDADCVLVLDNKRPKHRLSLVKQPVTKPEERSSEKRKNGEFGENTQSKKPCLNPSTSTTSVQVAIIELWDKTMKQYEDRITQLQEQLWEQQERSESLAEAYNEETRAARRLIAELETKNAALEEKVRLTRKTMEGLKILMEL